MSNAAKASYLLNLQWHTLVFSIADVWYTCARNRLHMTQPLQTASLQIDHPMKRSRQVDNIFGSTGATGGACAA
jgi:hypothetical protein